MSMLSYHLNEDINSNKFYQQHKLQNNILLLKIHAEATNFPYL